MAVATLPAPSAAPPRNANRDATTFLGLFLLAFLPYANIFSNQFVYDDGFQVVGNPYAHSFKYLRQIFTTTVWSFQGAQGTSNYYRPMMTFGYLLTYQVAGLAPWAFHLVNILLNGIVVCLVFSILRRLSGERVALVAAGLFALHPIHTEPVAWIASVTDLELAVFYLAAFLLYLKMPESNAKPWMRAAMCAAFVLALFSKEQAMTLPVVATFFEHFYRADRSATTPKEKLSRYAALWAIAAAYLATRLILMRGLARVLMRPNLSWPETVFSAVSLTGAYLGKLVWPARLSPFYIFHESRNLTDPGVLLGAAGLAVCAIFFAALWKRAHIVSFALLWLFLPLLPALNARWMPASVFGERYLYLPSIGFCWLLSWSAVQLWSGNVPGISRVAARAVPAAVAILALSYGVKTTLRNRDWRDNKTLYESVIRNQGDASLIRGNLGSVAYERGDAQLAEKDWLDALAAGPTNVHALDSMALIRRDQRRFAESVDYSTQALNIRPQDTFGHVNLGVTFAALGRASEAEQQFRTATALSPLSVNAHNTYGKFLLLQNRSEDARAEFETSVDADPNPEAYELLGEIYLTWQDLPRAERNFRGAISRDPSGSRAHVGLGRVLEFTGRTAEAMREYEVALAIDPSDAEAGAALNRLEGAVAPAQSR